MLKFYHSNDLDVLKGLLLHRMSEQPPLPLAHDALLVQSQGMAHWLKLNIADGLGVAAQLDFPLPSSFVWKVFNHLRPDLPERSHFDKQLMAWKLVRLLPELVTQPDCDAIAHYLVDDDSGIKCWQLSQTIADVFDQYLVYRPDWLLAWESGNDDIEDGDVSAHPWQPVVWRALINDSTRLGHSLSHRAKLLNELPALIAEHPERLSGLPKRLFVFGIAALPGSYWHVLDAISNHVDIHFFLLNPCRNFWGDIVDDRRRLRVLQQQPEAAEYLERGNPLLASWGRLGRDFLTLVHDSDLALDIEAYTDAEPVTLLNWIQRDILELHDRQKQAYGTDSLISSEFKHPVEPQDDSLKVVSAHSALREVQRLHDQLLFWFDQDDSLEPRDIVVMVPDVDLYAPYIDAVFASATHRIPWAIADQSLARENPVIESFLGLLGLADSRLLVTEVLDWLDVTAIRLRFGIDELELDAIKEWLRKANVRWGMNGQQRASLGLPEFEQNSWRQGLRQLVLGMMLPDDAPGWMGDWPVPAVEGTQAELLGKLLAFVDTLEYWQARLGEHHRPQDWLIRIPELVSSFYKTKTDTVLSGEQAKAFEQQLSSVQRIRDAIVLFRDDLSDSGMLCGDNKTEEDNVQQISPAVLRAWFNEQLSQVGGWQRFLAGPVNVCTLMPMRSIPFRVVCLLGMNDADYPRSVPPVGFDLMVSGRSRRGDRSRREDDRYLFLEAVCSAQQHLYLSYRGRSVRENTELQPSVLVSELLDYLGDGFCLPADATLPHKESRRHFMIWLVESLPLQPFSPLAFEAFESSRDMNIESSRVPGQQSTQKQVGSYQALWASVASARSDVDGKTIHSPAPGFVTDPLALPEALDMDGSIAWGDIKAALKNSRRFFMKRRLQAGSGIVWSASETEEPFTLDGLTAYLLKDQQLTDVLDKTDEESLSEVAHACASTGFSRLTHFTERFQALGSLPVNALGEYEAERIYQHVEPLALALLPWRHLPRHTGSLSYDVTGLGDKPWQYHIQGELHQLYDSTLIRYRPGRLRGVDVLDAWLDLVLLSACAPEMSLTVDNAYLYGLDTKTGEVLSVRIKAPDVSIADYLLKQCLAFYLDSWCQPQPLLTNLLWDLVQKPEEKHSASVAMAEQSEFSELNDADTRRCWPELASQLRDDDLRSEWLTRYQWVFRDLLNHVGSEEA